MHIKLILQVKCSLIYLLCFRYVKMPSYSFRWCNLSFPNIIRICVNVISALGCKLIWIPTVLHDQFTLHWIMHLANEYVGRRELQNLFFGKTCKNCGPGRCICGSTAREVWYKNNAYSSTHPKTIDFSWGLTLYNDRLVC